MRRTRIFNGNDTSLKEIPWQAGLTFDPNAADIFFFCGGTLINPSWVLSAYHCVDNTTWTERIWAVLGIVDTTKGSEPGVFKGEVDK